MQHKVHVELGERSYDIFAGNKTFADLGGMAKKILNPAKAIIISDSNVSTIYAKKVQQSLNSASIANHTITFPAGEDAKCTRQLNELYDCMFEYGADRKSCIIALGGGVTGDLAGFTAATFMRGIPFIQVPTSLLAQVDSSSGGKTGINHPHGKNLIGAFHQPSLVLVDTDTLKTLPKKELLSGMAEVVKHGIIRDETYFDFIEKNIKNILELDMETMREVILGSCRIKAEIVRLDEREGGIRALLNLGHTFGHAYESLSNYALRHGEGVSIGIIAACKLAETVLKIEPETENRIKDVFQRLGLPTRSPRYDTADLLDSMRGDKKTEHGRFRFVLPRNIGEAEIVTVDDEGAIIAALEYVME